MQLLEALSVIDAYRTWPIHGKPCLSPAVVKEKIGVLIRSIVNVQGGGPVVTLQTEPQIDQRISSLIADRIVEFNGLNARQRTDRITCVLDANSDRRLRAK